MTSPHHPHPHVHPHPRVQHQQEDTTTIAYSVSSVSDTKAHSRDFVIKLLVEEDAHVILKRIRLHHILDPTGKLSFDLLNQMVTSKVPRYYNVNNKLRLSYLDLDEDCIVIDSTDD